MKSKILFVGLFCFATLWNTSFAQDCSTSFTSHGDGSIISTYPVSMSGTAKSPVTGHVWILAHLEGFNGWYPQGNGERQIYNSKWTCTVYLGTPVERGYYEIAIAVVNDNVNQALNNWVVDAPQAGYPPIAFPDFLENCPISRIRVEKR